jgi:hypothetical protein
MFSRKFFWEQLYLECELSGERGLFVCAVRENPLPHLGAVQHDFRQQLSHVFAPALRVTEHWWNASLK